MSCGPTYGQFVAWLHAAGLLPPTPTPGASVTVTSGAGNVAGSPITAGNLVYVAGWDNVNACPMVALADATNLSTCATYITTTLVPAGLVAASTGTVAKQGTITGLALAAAIGDPAYLTATGTGGVQAGTTGLTTANVCQQIVGFFVTAGTSVYIDLSAAAVQTIGTSEFQNQSVTPAKADLTTQWTWTGTHPQIQLGTSGVLGAIDFGDGGTKLVRVQTATFAANRTLTIPDPGANATFILSVGTTALQITGAAPQITIGDGAGVSGVLRLNDGTAAVRHADITQATLAADRTYTVPDAGGNATFILSQGDTNLTLAGTAPQLALGVNGVAGKLTMGDGGTKKATVQTTSLAVDRTYTLPDFTGTIMVPQNKIASPPTSPGTANTGTMNIRFGNVQVTAGASTVTVDVTGCTLTGAAGGAAVFVTTLSGTATGGVVFLGRGAIAGSPAVLTITMFNAATGVAVTAATNCFFNYVILF